MCLKSRPVCQIPPEIAAWGATHLPDGNPYRLIGDSLYSQFRDEDFADLYHREGKPALSPVLLAFVTVFQALENLSDRAAANAVRIRLDWKYALHLPLDDDGFDSSVLCEFRQRLLAHNAEARVFEQVLALLKAIGLIKQRGIQRTDSLALLSRARTLHRIELVFETLRVALRAVLKVEKAWLCTILPAAWTERYHTHCRDERLSKDECAALELVVGHDGQWLLDRLAAPDVPAALRDLPAIALLQTVWQQHFVCIDGQMRFRQPHSDRSGTTHIETPYDPEAYWSQKGTFGWTGYKLQVTETDDGDAPHLITDVVVTSSITDDQTVLDDIATRQTARGVEPGTRFVDRGYMCGPTLAAADARCEDLVGPIARDTSPQAKLADGFTLKDFCIDLAQRTAICPAGHAGTPKRFRGHGDSGDHGIVFTFKQNDCLPCPLRSRCVTGKGQRFLTVRTHYHRLQQARERQATQDFQQAYARHRSGIEGCLSGLVRGQGLRRCRYIGQAKNQLRALFASAAVNLNRSAAWLTGKRHRPKRLGLQLAATTSR